MLKRLFLSNLTKRFKCTNNKQLSPDWYLKQSSAWEVFNLRPGETNYNSVLRLDTLRRHYEIIPLVIFAMCGVTAEISMTTYIAFSRDDVRYWKSMKTHSEVIDDLMANRPRIRKLNVVKQQYRVPEGFKEAMTALHGPD